MTAISGMRERVTLQSPARAADGAGGADVSWTDVATVWAQVDERTGGERLTGERLAARAALTVTHRYRAGVTTEMRALWNGRVLNIRAVRDKGGRKRFLTLECEEER